MPSCALRDGDGTPQAPGHLSNQWLTALHMYHSPALFSGNCFYPASVLCTLVNFPSDVHKVGIWSSQVDAKYPVESDHRVGTQWTLGVLCL